MYAKAIYIDLNFCLVKHSLLKLFNFDTINLFLGQIRTGSCVSKINLRWKAEEGGPSKEDLEGCYGLSIVKVVTVVFVF